jgi:hypothetical protein
MELDPNSIAAFTAMGYDPADLPITLIATYKALKKRKDVVFPGRMSPEMCAIVSVIADMISGDIDLRDPDNVSVKKPEPIRVEPVALVDEDETEELPVDVDEKVLANIPKFSS